MLTHPPLLYTGFVGLTVPYAFAMAALIAGKLDEAWILTTRRWTITAWLFLTLGNLVGAWWSYHVLGWGGSSPHPRRNPPGAAAHRPLAARVLADGAMGGAR